jgi:Family of unknown function (DUF6263)
MIATSIALSARMIALKSPTWDFDRMSLGAKDYPIKLIEIHNRCNHAEGLSRILPMNKVLIVSTLVGGMWGSISAAKMPAIAADSPATAPSTAATPITSKLEVLNPGVEPRRELRFRPVVNSKQTMTMTMGMSMGMSMGEMTMPKMALPKVVLKIVLNVTSIDPSGDIHYTFAYSDIQAIADKDTPPESLAAMQKSFKSLVGYKGDMVVTNMGKLKSKNMSIPNNVDPMLKKTLEQLSKSMEQVSTVLPMQMLGVGAKWQVTNSAKISNIQMNQSASYEVVKMDDRGITIRTKINQSAPPQNFQVPGMDAKTKVKLNSLTSTGEGRYVLRFDSLLPVEGRLLLNTDSNMSVQPDPKEEPTNVVSKLAIDLTLVGK